MERQSLRIPYVLAVFAGPAAIAVALSIYVVVLGSLYSRHSHTLRVVTATAIAFGLYASGAIVCLAVRDRIPRQLCRMLALVASIACVALIMFSFGHRTAGELLLVASIGALVMSAPSNASSARVVLRAPSRGTLLYWMLTLELPAFLLLALAARDYGSGNNTAAADFGSVWFLYLTYLFGYVGWSVIRAHTGVMAFFSACLVTFLGFAVGVLIASLGPISLIAPVAGIGGVVACIPHLWNHSPDNGATAGGSA